MSAEGLSDEVKQHLYVLPIHIKILLDQEEEFEKKILGYLRKDTKRIKVTKAKVRNEQKPINSNNAGNRPRIISFK